MGKRNYGTGTVTEMRAGVYRLRWRAGVDPYTGKYIQKSETFTGTKRDAQKRVALLAAVANDTVSSSITVGQLVELFRQRADIKPQTMLRYQYGLDAVPAGFFDFKAADLRPPHIADLYKRMLANGATVHTVRRVYVALSSIFRHGVEWGVCTINPCRNVRPPALERRPNTTPTVEQVRVLLAMADQKPGAFPVWFRLALTTGGRRNEVLAIRFSDVDLKAGKVRLVATKTGGQERFISLDADTTALLNQWHKQCRERALAVGHRLDGDGFVISDDPTSTTPWNPESTSQRFERLVAKAGFTKIRLHDLRHAHATMLLEAGVSVRTVADRLGHSRVSTTQDIYGHAIKGADEVAASTFSQLLGGSGTA